MTLQEKQEGYLQELGSLEDEFDQYTWLMQLACQRPELCQVAHQEERRFLGCQSNLWVELGCQEGRLSLSVDSDTLIVKGLAVMLAEIVTGCTPQEVAQGENHALLRRLRESKLADEEAREALCEKIIKTTAMETN